ncbi:uncharacterized protein LOC6725393 [Drosophila simulans]|uniref:uncharacterized protein LOC6725393 n=1 Tax=Drosophila simulans TaxID=7240 RepID=UPI00078AED62|nr:uncharacterized protein LOC6725393 [Drosophila simulans]XP_016038446.1 uncharacterized protein LOC6725393 [Drosophila simulans]XP_016038447.1 uncharacterized protein LOC6725393 [Drosophila simulans]XP_016038448.1 uncharacterized protein LOC6725393 [Drosophila simulans]KMZ08645.1 uncharacterized protein Dsimw501_GD16867, isoform B [Drosophila simulans]KMZ08646.1 uncharacterized protein Dsimw501_GD16867, isoform C [Drosophila simulans]KMZ08647.1 uncharacterized protein Dsimw501_GD16867, isof
MLPSAVHNVSLVYALVWAIDNYYGMATSTPLAVVQFPTSRESRRLHNDLIDAALGRSSGTGRIQFLLEDDRVGMTETDTDPPPPSGLTGRPIAIWFLDSLRSYFRLEMYLNQLGSPYKRNGFFLVVYTGLEDQPMESLKIMFRRLLNMYVLNVNVFLQRDETVHLYTYYPYGPHHCQSSLPVYYTAFQDLPAPATGFGLTKPLFPSKLANMHGCELVVATFEHRPYVIIEDDPKTPGGRSIRGIEGLIFRSLAERMNFTIKIVERKDKNRGEILPDGNFTGILKMMVDGEVNLTFVCFMYSKARSDLMLPSISYTSFPIVLVVPSGGSISPMGRLTRPFRYIIWSCILVSLICGFLLIFLLKITAVPRLRNLVLGRRNRLPFMGMWASLLGGLALYNPQRNFARYILVMWLLQTLILRAAYTGQLYLLLQDVDVRSPIKSLGEVQAKDYEFRILPALRTVFKDSMPNTNFHVVLSPEESLYRLRDEDDPGIAVPLLQPTINQFDFRSGPNKRHLTVLPDPLMTAPLTFYMRPHSYFKRRIDRLIMAMMSSGIVARYRKMYMDRIKQVGKRRNLEPKPLSIWRLSGIFVCCAGLYLLALIVFILEILTRNHRRLRRALNVINRYAA